MFIITLPSGIPSGKYKLIPSNKRLAGTVNGTLFKTKISTSDKLHRTIEKILFRIPSSQEREKTTKLLGEFFIPKVTVRKKMTVAPTSLLWANPFLPFPSPFTFFCFFWFVFPPWMYVLHPRDFT